MSIYREGVSARQTRNADNRPQIPRYRPQSTTRSFARRAIAIWHGLPTEGLNSQAKDFINEDKTSDACLAKFETPFRIAKGWRDLRDALFGLALTRVVLLLFG